MYSTCIYVCLCICLSVWHVYEVAIRYQKMVSCPLELELQAVMRQVLGNNLGTSERTALQSHSLTGSEKSAHSNVAQAGVGLIDSQHPLTLPPKCCHYKPVPRSGSSSQSSWFHKAMHLAPSFMSWLLRGAAECFQHATVSRKGFIQHVQSPNELGKNNLMIWRQRQQKRNSISIKPLKRF